MESGFLALLKESNLNCFVCACNHIPAAGWNAESQPEIFACCHLVVMLKWFFINVTCYDFYAVHILDSQSKCQAGQCDDDQSQEKAPTAWCLRFSVQHWFGSKNIEKFYPFIQFLKNTLFARFVFWWSNFLIVLILHCSINFCIIVFV